MNKYELRQKSEHPTTVAAPGRYPSVCACVCRGGKGEPLPRLHDITKLRA